MRSLRHALVLFAVIVVAIPLSSIAAWIAWVTVVPVYSARVTLVDMPVILVLRFHYTWDERDAGRSLQVTTPKATIRLAMTAFDWAHNARTSLYLTPRREIAVLGPMGDDHLISLDPPRRTVPRGPAGDWIYLGAFDYELLPRNGRRLRFVGAAEQAECIPMLGDEIGSDRVRGSARRRDCRHYVAPRALRKSASAFSLVVNCARSSRPQNSS